MRFKKHYLRVDRAALFLSIPFFSMATQRNLWVKFFSFAQGPQGNLLVVTQMCGWRCSLYAIAYAHQKEGVDETKKGTPSSQKMSKRD